MIRLLHFGGQDRPAQRRLARHWGVLRYTFRRVRARRGRGRSNLAWLKAGRCMSTDLAHLKDHTALETTQHPVFTTVPGTGRLQCLIVCPDARRRRDLADQTSDAGWTTFECADVTAANDLRRRLMLHLAVVDLAGPGGKQQTALRQLVSAFAHERDLLLVVSGQGSADEEIWARQLGVWIYLPGLVQVGELAPIFSEAHDLAERMVATRGSPLGGKTAWVR